MLQRRSHFLHFAVVAALLLRALIPVGFMPASASGAPTLVLCTAQGAKVIDRDHARAAHAQCAFHLALGMAALPSAPAALPGRVADAEIQAVAAATPSRGAALVTRARGPPVLV